MIDVVGPFCLSFLHMFPNAVIQPRQKFSFLQSSSRNAFLSIIDRNVLVQFSADSSTSLVNTAFQSMCWSILQAFAQSALSCKHTVVLKHFVYMTLPFIV